MSLGYKTFEPLAEGRETFSGIVGQADIDYRLRTIRLRATYRRDSRFSFYGDNVFFIENQIGGGVSLYLTRFLRLDYDYRYGSNAYPESFWFIGGEDVLIEREDIYQTHSAGIVVRVLRDIGIGLDVNYWERTSNVYAGKRDWLFVGGSLVYDF